MMEMNCGRNFYSCGGFSYIARNYRDKRIIERERRLEYRDNSNN